MGLQYTKKETFAMSVGFCGTPIYKKETFAMSVGFCVSLSNNFSMSVGFCGTQYNKKNHLQCLWGSVVVLIIIFQCLWGSVGLNILKKIICNVCGVLW